MKTVELLKQKGYDVKDLHEMLTEVIEEAQDEGMFSQLDKLYKLGWTNQDIHFCLDSRQML